MSYEEIRLKQYKYFKVFSFLFLTVFYGEILVTNKIFGKVKIKAEKIKYRYYYFNEWYYQMELTDWKFKWRKI